MVAGSQARKVAIRHANRPAVASSRAGGTTLPASTRTGKLGTASAYRTSCVGLVKNVQWMRYPDPAMQAMNPDSIDHAAELIAQSDALIVAAGAGRCVGATE